MRKLLILSFLFSFQVFAKDKKKCTYTLVEKSEKIGFTGYKFVKKTGVDGSFKNTKVTSSAAEADSVKKVVENASFWINALSFDAGNAARNKNILEGLWNNIPGTTMSGFVQSIDEKKKKIKFRLDIGKSDHDLEADYKYENNEFSVNGKIDLVKLGLGKAFKALSKKCAPFHKGKDGKTKTWSEVAIRITAKIVEKCK